MQWETSLTSMLQISYPIIQAGMAGGTTTPDLVLSVSNAGGLGTIGAGYMTPAALQEAIRSVKTKTDRPFAVNLFVPGNYPIVETQITEMAQYLKPYREHLGLTDELPTHYEESFREQVDVILREDVPAFSFTFGIPSEDVLRALQRRGVICMGTATTVREAILLEAAGLDAIVAQGYEAGGHRGTFIGSVEQSSVGTMALIPQMADSVRIPVIASGGIMDGRGVLASLALGASGVQLGTAFLTSEESGAHALYKEQIVGSSDESTALTKAFSGKAARGLVNDFMKHMEAFDGEIPPYPVQNALTRDLRKAAGTVNRTEWMSLWAGQAGHLAKLESATEIFSKIVRETEERAQRFQ